MDGADGAACQSEQFVHYEHPLGLPKHDSAHPSWLPAFRGCSLGPMDSRVGLALQPSGCAGGL